MTAMTVWNNIKETTPANGQVCMLKLYGNNFTVATFCDGIFYQLTYDDHLGVLRKMPVNDAVEAWCDCISLALQAKN